MWRIIRQFIAIFLLFPAPALAADYHAGPGQSYASIGAVPWESLAAGDHVYIHARPTPYYEKWVINRVGTPSNPIIVSGVPDSNGNLPVIYGEGATTRTQLNYWNEDRGIVKIGGSNSPPDGTPAWIVVENIHFRRARGSFTGRNGASTYNTNAAAVYVEKGDHITIRNCIVEDNGNGLFVASASSDVVIEGNYIYGNGNLGSIYEHNTYTEARGIIYQYNRFGPLCSGCGGNNLKDRSSGTVIRYNWIESGNRQLDLVDAEDSDALVNDPAYDTTFVYGNILIEPDGAGNSQIVHFGGDSGDESIYRGTLYFWNNTVVSTRSGNTTLLRLSTNAQTADVRNNIIYVTASGDRLALSDSTGTLNYGWNLFKPGYVASHDSVTGAVTNIGGNITASNPGFAGEASQNYQLLENSPARSVAGGFNSATASYPLDREYLKHQSWLPRPVDSHLDMGAFESPADATLTVTISGSGTVNSVTQGQAFTCETGQCAKSFPYNTSLDLAASPSLTSLFTGWSGACSNTTGNCHLTMDGARSATATFTTMPPVRTVGSETLYFQTVTEAYAATLDGSTVEIQAQGVTLADSAIYLNRTIQVTLKGGYDSGFSDVSGDTTLAGALTIGLGSLIVELIIIR